LLEKYQDQEMELADACLVRMAELKRDCRVFTLDKAEFQIYRRFERQVIPLIMPQ
jgi:predicted nucleic acid-binding protein